MKLSQNKPAADRAGVVAGLHAAGDTTMAVAMADIAAAMSKSPPGPID